MACWDAGLSALRPRSRGVFVETSAGVSIAVALGIPAHIALELLREMGAGVNAAMKKIHQDDEG